MSPAVSSLGLGGMLKQQQQDQSEELRKKKQKQQQLAGMSPAVMNLFGQGGTLGF